MEIKSTVFALIVVGLFIVPSNTFGANETAIFAGGKFYYLEREFENTYGVIDAETGYTGGTGAKPDKTNYAASGFVEAIRVSFDPSRVRFAELLDGFFRAIDPTDADGQFKDRGRQFRTIVFWLDEGQKKEAEAAKTSIQKSGRFQRPIVTTVEKASAFFPASREEQDYASRRMATFELARAASGRYEFARKIWGIDAQRDVNSPPSAKRGTYKKEDEALLAKRLSPLQFDVTQREGTESPYNNAYWDNHDEGIYVDIVSGEPLFSSRDKYESGTGWPSFMMPLSPSNIVTKTDYSFGMVRVEARSRYADSHLGHIFDDGPPPTGLRYCMNSASMRFIPLAEMEKEGYGRFLKFFGK